MLEAPYLPFEKQCFSEPHRKQTCCSLWPSFSYRTEQEPHVEKLTSLIETVSFKEVDACSLQINQGFMLSVKSTLALLNRNTKMLLSGSRTSKVPSTLKIPSMISYQSLRFVP
ncbi:hypothetical protein V6N13_111107 [Hibiscus sabdariffa]|uniref:Uncharacterized protein n=1 Tax=Hibiscus sabdariffa TaxID=183260 RepID=A0ABR2TJI3_9ROSI